MTTSSAVPAGLSSVPSTALPAWRVEADARSRAARFRSTTLRLSVNGTPLAGAQVRVQQMASDLRLGTCLRGSIVADTPTAAAQRDLVRGLCSIAVAENRMKWYCIEKTQSADAFAPADALLAFCDHARIALRGHCLFWDKAKFVQPWVQALDAPALRRAAERRIATVCTRWRGRLAAWDVNNEILDGGFFASRLGDGIHAELFRLAAAADPQAPLFTNEYGILDNDAKTERYLALLDDLRTRGGPVHGIGIQEHAAERFVAGAAEAAAAADTPERQGRGPLIVGEVWQRLDRLAATGLPIHLTEISIKCADPVRRADNLEMFLRTAHAHPAVDAFLLWGLHGSQHWLGADAGIAADDSTSAPPLARLRALLAEWTTSTTATTDAEGRIPLSGWCGDYHLIAGPHHASMHLPRRTPKEIAVAMG